MTDLSDEAKALFESARAAHEPSDADRRRVLRGVLQGGALAATSLGASASAAAVGGSAAGAAASAGGAAVAASSLGFGAKLLFGAVLVGSAGFGLYRVTRAPSELATQPALHANAAPAPQIVPHRAAHSAAVESAQGSAEQNASAPGPGLEPVGEEPTRRPSSPADKSPSNAGRLEPSALASQARANAAVPVATGELRSSALTEEARALAEVQRALRAGQGGQALRLLDQQRVAFPAGELAPERAAARIVALCAVGRVGEARREGAQFLEAAPHSPLAARVRASCALP